jgi:hypothetical protein
VTMSVREGDPGAAAAAGVALGMAMRAGFPPLAADRVRGAIRRALDGSGEAKMTFGVSPGQVRVELAAQGEAWRRGALDALATHDPQPVDGGVVVVFRAVHRGALRAVGQA